MGDRGQIKLVTEGEPDIYLYSHWGASVLPSTVAKALDRGRSRWLDDEYLNRIIFSELIKGEVEDLTGYGIGTSLHGDVWRVVEVNHTQQTVKIAEADYNLETKETTWETRYVASFDDFVKNLLTV